MMNSTNTTFSVSLISHGTLTQEQILIVAVSGACGALLVFALIAVAYAILCSKRRRRGSRQRHNSQVSVARSDFWPFATATPPPSSTQFSPDYPRHVFFEDDPRLTLASRASHVPDARMFSGSRTNSLATLERGLKDVTLVYQPRSRVTSDGDFVPSSPTEGPMYVNVASLPGRSPYHRDLRMVHFNRGAFVMGHDPFLWKPGTREDQH